MPLKIKQDFFNLQMIEMRKCFIAPDLDITDLLNKGYTDEN
jgi:hypothetical protein